MTDPIILVPQPIQPVVIVPIAGIAGPPGAPGSAGGSGYIYTQSTPAASWSITHNLGRYPLSVMVVIGTSVVVADVSIPNSTQVSITFPSPTTGTAYLV